MADNTLLNAGTGGDTIASDDIAGVKYQRNKLVHGADGVNAGDVSTANPFPIQTRDSSGNALSSLNVTGTTYAQLVVASGSNYINSTGNSTVAQLASAATFTGTIESILSQSAVLVSMTSDQNGTLTLKQYIDAGGTRALPSIVVPVTAGTAINQSWYIIGNYFNLTFINNGGVATTTLNISTYYGEIQSVSDKANMKMALNEVNGTTISLGSAAAASSLPIANSTEDIARMGIITETAPASDTASSGVNGRLQRIAQRITSLIAQIPAALGQGTMAQSMSVAIASNQSAVPVDTELPAAAALADATANPTTPLAGSAGLVFNGTTWDRVKSGQSAATATLTGYQNFLAGAIYNTTAPTLTNGQTVPMQLDVNGNKKIVQSIANATGNITTQNLVPTGTATAASAVEATITSQGLALVQVTGTYTGALSLQYTVDGSNWITSNDASFYNTNSGLYSATIASAATGIFRIPTAASTKVRITGLAAMTGTATVTINASNTVWAFQTNQNINQNLVGGATITVNKGVAGSGTQRTIEAQEITYRASTIIPLVAAVTVNVPFANIIGSATKTVVVKRITVSGMTQTAVGYFPINVEKLSTASTGGTSTTLVATPLDANDAAATAVVKAYTVAPTKGTLIGTLRSWRALWQATTATSALTATYDFNFGDLQGSNGITLRGVAQEIALTFPVVLATAGTLAVDVEWVEY